MPSRTQSNLSSSGIGLRRAVGQAIGAASGIGPVGGGRSPLLNNLVAYWNLNETSGNRADSSANGYTLTDNNTVGSATGVGAGQTAADFVRANSESLSRAYVAALNPASTDWTMAGWQYIDTTDTQICAGSGSVDSAVTPGWDLLSTGGTTLAFRSRNAANSGSVQALVSSLSTGAWRFVVFGYDATAGEIFLEVNRGTPSATSSAGGVTPSASDFALGTRGSLATAYMDGRWQSVGVWGRALTTAELDWLYNAGTAARLYSDVEAYTG